MSFLDLLILLPDLFFINFILIFLWVGLYLRYKLSAHTNTLFYAFNIYANFLLLIEILLIYNNSFWNAQALLNNYLINDFAVTLKFFTLITSSLVLLTVLNLEKELSVNSWDIEINILRLFVVSAMLLILSVNDFIYLFFIIELYSLTSYILIGYRGKLSVFSGEASLKYFILGTIFSILMGYSIAVIYWTTGLTNFVSLELYLNISNFSAYYWTNFDLIDFAFILFLISIFFKLAAAPFHFWAPDVYEGAPTTSMYFLFVVPKIAFLAILIKLAFIVSTQIGMLAFILSAIISLVVGSVGGLFQTKIKRLLTYSMINNNGFFLLALIVTNIYSVAFILFFLFIYTLTLVGLFTSLLSLRLYSNFKSLKNIWSWSSLFFVNRIQSIVTSLFLFSSAGIPPLVGFVSKFFIFFTLLLSITNLHWVLAVALVLAPLTCFYYIRLIKNMAFSKKSNWIFLRPLSAPAAYTISFTVIALFILFIASGPFINLFLVMSI